jgi:isocitrate dehydrogenase (NAD+)
MAYEITLIPGDGIGPEVIEASKRVLEAKFNWEIITKSRYSNDLDYQKAILSSVSRNKVGLKGPTTTIPGMGSTSLNSVIRKSLDLFACVRPCKNIQGIPSPYNNVDIVVVRENTEDLHVGFEFDNGSCETAQLIPVVNKLSGKVIKPDASISLKIITRSASQKIIDFAFNYARKNNRKMVTVVHKATVSRATDGLFLNIAREIAVLYPDIVFNDVLIDNFCMQLVRNPRQFDVLVMPNLFGDIVSDLCAGLVGGIGVAPGANYGKNIAVFESAHGSAPKYAGQNKVNPIAAIRSGILMLRYLNETESADRLEKAMLGVISEGFDVTYDLKPNGVNGVGTSRVADAIIETMYFFK